MARKLALIIGNSQYEDTGLARLAAPDVDVRALAEVLQTPGIGGFDEVTPLLNEGLATVRKAIARFFDLKHRDDLLVLYFSGHGVRDEQGHLYLAVRDTERAVLAGTAIEASYVTTRMDRSASKRLVLVLDCCHSGAFGHGSKSAQGAAVGTASAFEGTGRGRVVLTATDSTQYAWEGDQVIGDVETSLFTHYMIEGLRTGAADRDEDGRVTIDELYDYVYEHVLNETPRQTPGKWAFGQQGDIVIASNPAATRARLPPEIEDALASKLPSVRLEAVRELENILRGRHPARAQAAIESLRKLTEDDSRRVATAADEVLKSVERDVERTKPEAPGVLEAREAAEQQRQQEAREAAEQERQEEARAAAEQKRQEEVRAAAEQERQLEAREAAERKRQEEAARQEEEARRLEEKARREQAERDSTAAEIAAAVAGARTALGRGALDDVHGLLERVLDLSPQHEVALQLRETLRQRIDERVRLEEAEKRIRELRQRIGSLIAKANGTDDHDEAIALLSEALGLDPEHAEVKELLEDRYRLRAEAEAAERRARSIAGMKERIARHLERDEIEEAAQALASAASLDAPAGTFEPLHAQLDALTEQRRRDAEEAAWQRAEAERRAREEQLERHLASASSAIADRRFVDALDALASASALDSDAAGIADLVQSAQDGLAALEAEARKQQEIETHLAEASRHLTRGNLTKAIVIADVVLRLDPEHKGAHALHTDIQEAIEKQKKAEELAAQERERQRQIEDRIASAESAATHDTAVEILNEVLALDPDNVRARRMLKKRQAEFDRAKAEQRRQDAIRARADAERVAREEHVAQLMAAARSAIDERRYADAVRALGAARELAPDAPVSEALQAAEAGLAAERAAEESQRAIERALGLAGKRLRRGDYAGALGHVDAALAYDSGHQAALALRAEIQQTSEVQAENPPASFSLRPTLSMATRWLYTTARSNTFRAGMGLVLAVGLAVTFGKPGSEAPPTVESVPTAGTSTPASLPPTETSTPASVPPAGTSSPGSVPPAETAAPAPSPPTAPMPTPQPSNAAGTGGGSKAPEPATPADPTPALVAVPPARSEDVAAAERSARRQLEAGRAPEALRIILSGLAIDPADAGLLSLLRDLAADAQVRASRAAKTARQAGSHVPSSKAFTDGTRATSDADKLREALRFEPATRRYWAAAQLFEEAARTTPPAPASSQPLGNATVPITVNPSPSAGGGNSAPSSAPNTSSGRGAATDAGTTKPAPPSPTTDRPGPAPSKNPESPSWSLAVARHAAERLVDQYEAALETLNVDAFKALWPTIPRDTERNLRKAFNGYKQVSVDVSNCVTVFVPPNGAPTTAMMTCRERNRITLDVSGRRDITVETRLMLRAVGQSWVIVDWSRTPTDR
jgi:Caspase domain